ncbi:DUF4249 domain-containing protein [Pedobacter frigoris]|uniref:DUF4249 domain-containing protein n=1 Tax=Pedobacter frigoris TaxID=2571272 RepID=A0A4U1CJF3_9SPHI|nr:hypothetical protein [Pedobacter frigoris]TKC07577.1 hypothetical protein FA047_10070 [Pedobacter frigoris]
MNRCWIYFLLTGLLIAFGCKKSALDDNSFLKPVRQYDMAIEGGINTRTTDQYIRLTKPALSPDSSPVPIRKAVVVVNDGRTDIAFKEVAATPGVYVGLTKSDPNYNKAYILTIKYNNKTYTAVDTLRQVVNIIDDFLPLSTRAMADKSVNGTIPKHTFGYLNPNKWYISYPDLPLWNPSKFDQSKYYSYTHILGSPNSLYPLNNLKRTFAVGQDDYISIYKISLSENYAKYLYSVFMETDWSGLFSSVPVNVEGNVSGNVLGYFSVSDVDYRRYKAKEL